jgi:hypothetical protein
MGELNANVGTIRWSPAAVWVRVRLTLSLNALNAILGSARFA